MPLDHRPSEGPEQLNTRSAAWYEGLPTVSAGIDCGGEGHRITWRRGKLVLEDHDILAEQSLAALGAKPPICLQVLDAWRAMRDSELFHELLLKESRHSPEVFGLMKTRFEARMETAQTLPQRAAERRGREKRRWVATLVRALPSGLRRMLALSVVVNAQRHWDDEEFRRQHAKHIEPALKAITAPLFERSARRWRHNFKPYPRFGVEASLLAPGEPATCMARADSGGAHAALALPISWFTDVWSRDIALVDDSLVMGLMEPYGDEPELRVLGVRWERQGWETSSATEAPALLTQGRRGNWRLEWL
ncbi:MAG: hypothetical protein M3Z33_04805 [Actinomycetota bacterium]|nr:hypothetical protein [Actinomycetota bacterium]